MEHCIALISRRYGNGPVGVRQAVGLDDALAARQDVSVVVELQRGVLRRVGQRVEGRGPHMLRGEVLVLVDHVRRGEMAERRRVLMQTGGNHVASVRRGLGHHCTSRQPWRASMAGASVEAGCSPSASGVKVSGVRCLVSAEREDWRQVGAGPDAQHRAHEGGWYRKRRGLEELEN